MSLKDDKETKTTEQTNEKEESGAQENLLLKAQLSAIKGGVNPQYVEDAVYLAC